MTPKADIAIIGGGIAGVGLAAEISGFADVILFEAEEEFGYHATGRSAAMFEPNYGNNVINTLTCASRAQLEKRDVLSPRGVLTLADYTETHLLPVPNGKNIHALTIDEAIALVPILNEKHISSATLSTSASEIDVDKLFQSFLRKARSNGTKFVNRARVEQISGGSGSWEIHAGGQDYAASTIVNAAGAWADDVARMAGATPFGIQPFRRSVALIPAPGGWDVTKWPMLLSASESWYAKPDAGKWLVSPAEEDPIVAMDVWPDDMVLAKGLDRYQAFVTQQVTRVERSWAGLRSFAKDRTPVVGFDPTCEGFFWLAGQGGYGVQTAPAMSFLASNLLAGQAPVLDTETIAALSPVRRM